MGTNYGECRHCGRVKSMLGRRLCWKCSHTPGVRDLYPVTSKYGNRGVAEFTGSRPLPAAPTAALPGTPEKEGVLAARAEAGEQLHHPADTRHGRIDTAFLLLARLAG